MYGTDQLVYQLVNVFYGKTTRITHWQQTTINEIEKDKKATRCKSANACRPSGEEKTIMKKKTTRKKSGPGKPKKRAVQSRNPNYGDTKMHEATCESCGKTCGVPFKPNGKKPVYCSLCFKQDRREESKTKKEDSAKELEAVNKKLDRILRLLEK